jgi:retron-type reverse transcriptase
MSSVERLRERIAAVGKPAAILEEMTRLGFVTQSDLQKVGLAQTEVTKILNELEPTTKELREVEAQIASTGNLPELLALIRTERIALVKANREKRNIEKARLRQEKHDAWEQRKRKEGLFLGVGVSSRLTFEGGDADKISKAGLPVANTLAELAALMNLTTDDLVWLCYERGATDTDHYSRFEIPKRSGGTRLISSPKPKMRKAQSWINDQLLSQLTPSTYCYAFRPELSIVDNASKHLNKKLIVKCDIKDFFPSITFPRVRGYFEYLGYNPGVATVLALLCTDAPRARVTIKGNSMIVALGDRALPQGACTSPALANLIASRLDSRLAGLARVFKGEWIYTRYADDLTFSTDDAEAELGKFLAAVTRITADEKFVIKPQKTRIMRAPMRQTVTGLVVGDAVRIPKATIKKVRALFHSIEKLGEEAVSAKIGSNAINVAHGYWSYFHMVDPDLAKKYLSKYPWLAVKRAK